MTNEVSPWFDDRFRLADASASLYCFPYAGGTAAYYVSWAERFNDTIELVPVQLPGRGSRMAEPSPTNMAVLADQIATRISTATTRPLLFGHSMGAITAFEVARRLQRLGRPAGYLFVSGRTSPPIRMPKSIVSTLPRAEFIQILRDFGAAPDEILDHDELLDVLLPMIRADFAVIERYRYEPGPALTCPILGWCGDRDADAAAEDMRGWGDMTTGAFRFVERPGGHFFLTEHQAEITDMIHCAASLSGRSR